jgi:hypothetical protein
MHNTMPTDENLSLRGCSLPSMCSFCCKTEETSFHIFFECEFAVNIWSWFANCLDLVLQFHCMDDMWKTCDLNWSPQSKVVISSALVNLLNPSGLPETRSDLIILPSVGSQSFP